MYRTFYNNEVSKKELNQRVELVGWIKTIRDFGAFSFIDLRDRSGIIQLVIKDKNLIKDLGNEDVITIKGIVNLREQPNLKLLNGDIEVIVEELKLLSKAALTPFIIDDKTDALEDTRLKYRYLDLRRPILQKNLKIRAQITQIVHSYLDRHDFLEIETPLLCLSTPEGARDYLVPSRVNKGSFYALPQSPQIFKQLLMIGGLERYYQVAKCLRDEDLRSDRQPEFTQIDIETSFLGQDELLTLMEGLLKEIFQKIAHYDLTLPLRRLPYLDAIAIYGSDKPDTRFDLKLCDLEDVLRGHTCPFFHDRIRGFVVNNYAHKCTRKELDRLNLEAKKFLSSGLYMIKKENGEIVSSLKKFFNDAIIERLDKHFLEEGDVLLLGEGPYLKLSLMLGAIRKMLGDELNLYDKNSFDLLWVTDFPLFEKRDDGTFTSSHHPFTRPKDESLNDLDNDPSKVLSYAYDIVINGYEAGGGSLRIYDKKIQNKVFEILGLSAEDIKRKFGFFIEAFNYGTPPHGGLAFGLERLTMILAHTDNIRDVIAFPKNLKAIDMMSNAPKPVDESQLKDLGIAIIKNN